MFPVLRDKLEIEHVKFPRPRPAIIAEVGEANQGAPVLVIGRENPPNGPEIEIQTAPTGKKFVSGDKQIGYYLAAAYGVAKPH